jgi:hypothetical protein
MCSAWRFCLPEYFDLSPRGMNFLLQQTVRANNLFAASFHRAWRCGGYAKSNLQAELLRLLT